MIAQLAPSARGWRTPAAVAAAGALLALAAVLPAHAVPAAVAPPVQNAAAAAQLALSGGDQSFLLRAGVPAHWQIGVTTRQVRLTALVEWISASGELAEGPGGASVSLALASCREPWAGTSCAGGATALLAATPLAELAGQQGSLADAAGIPANAYLLATVLLPQDASAAAEGRSATVTIHVTAAGDELTGSQAPGDGGAPGTEPGRTGTAGTGPGDGDRTGTGERAAQPAASFLADTGSRVGVFATLAVAAVGTGALLAALARRRNDRGRHP